MKSGAKQYVRACRNMLPFYGKKERTFIKKLADDLDQEKDYATICEEAGNPKDTAMAYLENCDEKGVQALFAQELLLLILVIIIVFIIYACYMLIEYNRLAETQQIITEEVTIIEED